MSIKVAQNDFYRKIIFFDTFTNIAKECRRFGQIICCLRLWKVAQSPINHPIWSHCALKRTGSHLQIKWDQLVRRDEAENAWGKVSLYGWSPVWPDWILPNKKECCSLYIVKLMYPYQSKWRPGGDVISKFYSSHATLKYTILIGYYKSHG